MKIKFIHYKPYEYELLQEELDKLGSKWIYEKLVI